MDKPYQELGVALKNIRGKKNETIAEVSQAVEVDVEFLAKVENGHERPSEEVLMLLISHFDINDDEAVKIWQLAGYDNPQKEAYCDDNLQSRNVVMLMALDSRILYSDDVNIAVNRNGLVVNFLQSGGNGQMPVSRIGMSLEQAESVLESLKQAVDCAHLARQPKALPARAKLHKAQNKKIK